MNFKLPGKSILLLASLTAGIGVLQVLTPILMRIFVDGILPGKDLAAIAAVVLLMGGNELLLLLGTSALNRSLDEHETRELEKMRNWMLEEIQRPGQVLKNPEAFYQAWSQDARRLVYKKIKNLWFRTKDLIILFLLTLICLNISYLAGLMILVIASASFILIKFHQENQAADVAQMHQLESEERKLFFASLGSSRDEKMKLHQKLNELSSNLNQVLFNISRERTVFQDFNSSIRFFLMFSILGIGGYLYSTEKVSMGSIWALILTMYRITPPLQSLARWSFQIRSDENLEGRILSSMEQTNAFHKPPFYNRLVKIVEKSLKTPGNRVVELDPALEKNDVLKAMEMWQSFYTKKEMIVISEEFPSEWEEEKIYFLFTPPRKPCPSSVIFFIDKKLSGSDRENWQIQELN